ncbi:disulfide bond formation protein B [Pseudomonas viridiflava]|uniref:disulfide bond formation protein B n=1 Tax=Pseudomonas viridiflava TaxID=33069 RepID=UPI00311FEC9D
MLRIRHAPGSHALVVFSGISDLCADHCRCAYQQHAVGLEPCLLCLSQRAAMVSCGVLTL